MYKRQEALLAAGDNIGAGAYFKAAGNYADALQRAGSIYYSHAQTLQTAGDRLGAAEAYAMAGDYEDAPQLSEELYLSLIHI